MDDAEGGDGRYQNTKRHNLEVENRRSRDATQHMC